MSRIAPPSLSVAPLVAAPRSGPTPEAALDMLTNVARPAGVGVADWESRSTTERLETATMPTVQLARAKVVNDGRTILVVPEKSLRSDLPGFDLPNNVGAVGFRPGIFLHDYIVTVTAPPSLRGQAGLQAVGRALVNDPTPGKDRPASPTGTLNDVGALVHRFDGPNHVRSYSIQSSDPRRSAAVVNYTTRDHVLDEGFVIRFAELRPDGRIDLVTYGEGVTLPQVEALSRVWEPQAERAWRDGAEAVFRAAQEGR